MLGLRALGGLPPRFLLGLAYIVCSSEGWGGISYPPVLTSTAEQQTYILGTLEKYPWVQTLGIAGNLPAYVPLQQQWLKNLYELAEFKELNATRPDPLSIRVQESRFEKRTVRTLAERERAAFAEEVSEHLRTLWESGEDSELAQEIQRRAVSLAESDPRSLATGLINCLPKARRTELFQLSVENQLDALANEPTLTDEAIAGGFKAGPDFPVDSLKRGPLLARLQKLLTDEEELVSLIRTHWFLSVYPNAAPLLDDLGNLKLSAILEIVNAAPASALDPSDEGEEAKKFLSDLATIEGLKKEARPGVERYLGRVFKSFKNGQRTEMIQDVAVPTHLFTIQEVVPEIGIYRGVVGGDCSLANSYAFPFSPMERVFYFFTPNGDPMKVYAAGTVVEVNGVRTFYVHDIAGPGLTEDIQTYTLHALYAARKLLGVDQLSLPTLHVRNANAGQEPNQNATIAALIAAFDRYLDPRTLVNHHYLDTEVRQFLGSQPHSALNYDSPSYNAQGHLFVPDRKVLDKIQSVLAGSSKTQRPVKAKSNRHANFLKLLDLFAGNEPSDLYFEELGFSRDESNRLVALTNNHARLPLQEYYAALELEFKAHDGEMSEKFIKKHARYFVYGHLAASNATTIRDADLRDRTIEYTIETIKRGRNRDFAYKLVAEKSTFFHGNPEFQEYVSSISLRGADNVERARRLAEAGVGDLILADSVDRVLLCLKTNSWELNLLALKWLSAAANRKHIPDQLPAIARVLRNEKAGSDEPSLEAIKLLLEFPTAEASVVAELLSSAKHEENATIGYRAAIAYLQNGGTHKKAYARLEKNQDNEDLPKALRIQGKKLLAARQANACLDELTGSDNT